ncbi:MAG TPA: hypothetical protein PKN82_09420, partial [Thauera sp.]|nr:hypothetical protein [Thauera sp.]
MGDVEWHSLAFGDILHRLRARWNRALLQFPLCLPRSRHEWLRVKCALNVQNRTERPMPMHSPAASSLTHLQRLEAESIHILREVV